MQWPHLLVLALVVFPTTAEFDASIFKDIFKGINLRSLTCTLLPTMMSVFGNIPVQECQLPPGSEKTCVRLFPSNNLSYSIELSTVVLGDICRIEVNNTILDLENVMGYDVDLFCLETITVQMKQKNSTMSEKLSALSKCMVGLELSLDPAFSTEYHTDQLVTQEIWIDRFEKDVEMFYGSVDFVDAGLIQDDMKRILTDGDCNTTFTPQVFTFKNIRRYVQNALPFRTCLPDLLMVNLEELVISRYSFKPVTNINVATKLRRLKYIRNKEFKLSPSEAMTTLSKLTVLEEIDLSHTFTGEVVGEWPPLEELRNVYLSDCGIVSIVTCTFCRLRVLQVLDLSYNNLLVLPDILLPAHRFRTFNLSHNLFAEWPELGHLAVDVLDLDSNSLTDFKNVENGVIGNLVLSRNFIKEWHYFGDLASVQTSVDLSGNNIPVLTPDMGRTLVRRFDVNLSNNPLDCASCHMDEFQHWLKKRAHSELLLCSAPDRLRGRHVSQVEQQGPCTAVQLNAPLVVGSALGPVLFLLSVLLLLAYKYRPQVQYMLRVLRERRTNRGAEQGALTYDAFVCYSHHDRPWVMGRLVPTLEKSEAHYRLCLHERDFSLGSSITRNIVQAMDRSRHVIVILSQHFITSKWCQMELELANHCMFESNYSFLVLIGRGDLTALEFPRSLKHLVETRTFIQWPVDDTPESDVTEAFERLKVSMGTSISQQDQQV